MASKLLPGTVALQNKQTQPYGEDGIRNSWEFARLVRMSLKPDGLEIVCRYIDLFQQDEVEQFILAWDNIDETVSQDVSATRLQFLLMLYQSPRTRFVALSHMVSKRLEKISHMEFIATKELLSTLSSIDEKQRVYELVLAHLSESPELRSRTLELLLKMWNSNGFVEIVPFGAFLSKTWDGDVTLMLCELLLERKPEFVTQSHWSKLRQDLCEYCKAESKYSVRVTQIALTAMISANLQQGIQWFQVIRCCLEAEDCTLLHRLLLPELVNRSSLVITILCSYEAHWQMSRALKEGDESWKQPRLNLLDFELLLAIADSSLGDASVVVPDALLEAPITAIHQTRTELASALASHVLLVLGMEYGGGAGTDCNSNKTSWLSSSHLDHTISVLTSFFSGEHSGALYSSHWRIVRLIKIAYQWCQAYPKSQPYFRVERETKVFGQSPNACLQTEGGKKPFRCIPDLLRAYQKEVRKFLLETGKLTLISIFHQSLDFKIRAVIVQHLLKTIMKNSFTAHRNAQIHITGGREEVDADADLESATDAPSIAFVTEGLMNLFQTLVTTDGNFLSNNFEKDLLDVLENVLRTGSRGLVIEFLTAMLPLLHHNNSLLRKVMKQLEALVVDHTNRLRQIGLSCCAALYNDVRCEEVLMNNSNKLLDLALSPFLSNKFLTPSQLMDYCELITKLCNSHSNRALSRIEQSYLVVHRTLIQLLDMPALAMDAKKCIDTTNEGNVQLTSAAESIGHLLVTLWECEEYLCVSQRSFRTLEPSASAIAQFLENTVFPENSAQQLLGSRGSDESFPTPVALCLGQCIVHAVIEFEFRRERSKFGKSCNTCLCSTLNNNTFSASRGAQMDMFVQKVAKLCQIRAAFSALWSSLPLQLQRGHMQTNRPSSWFTPLPVISVCTALSIMGLYSSWHLERMKDGLTPVPGALDGLQLVFDTFQHYMVIWNEDQLHFECGLGEPLLCGWVYQAHQLAVQHSARTSSEPTTHIITEHAIQTSTESATRTLAVTRVKLDIAAVLILLLCRSSEFYSSAPISPQQESLLKLSKMHQENSFAQQSLGFAGQLKPEKYVQAIADSDSSDFEHSPFVPRSQNAQIRFVGRTSNLQESKQEVRLPTITGQNQVDERKYLFDFSKWILTLPRKFMLVLQKEFPECSKESSIDFGNGRFERLRNGVFDWLFNGLSTLGDNWGYHTVNATVTKTLSSVIVGNVGFEEWLAKLRKRHVNQNRQDPFVDSQLLERNLEFFHFEETCSLDKFATILTICFRNELSCETTIRTMRGYLNCISDICLARKWVLSEPSWLVQHYIPLVAQQVMRKFIVFSPLAIRRLVRTTLLGDWSNAFQWANEIVQAFLESKGGISPLNEAGCRSIEEAKVVGNEALGTDLGKMPLNVAQVVNCANNAVGEVISLVDSLSQQNSLIAGVTAAPGTSYQTLDSYQVFQECVELTKFLWNPNVLKFANSACQSKLRLMTTHLFAAGTQSAILIGKGVVTVTGDKLNLLASLWPSEYKRLKFSAAEVDSIHRSSTLQPSAVEQPKAPSEKTIVLQFDMEESGGTTEINFAKEGDAPSKVPDDSIQWSGLLGLLEVGKAIRQWVVVGQLDKATKRKMAKFLKEVTEFEHRLERALVRMIRRIRQESNMGLLEPNDAIGEETNRVEVRDEDALRDYFVRKVGEGVKWCAISTNLLLKLLRACDNLHDFVEEWEDDLENYNGKQQEQVRPSAHRDMDWVLQRKKRKRMYSDRMNRNGSSNAYIAVALEDEESGSDNYEDLEEFIDCGGFDTGTVAQPAETDPPPSISKPHKPKVLVTKSKSKASRRVNVVNIASASASSQTSHHLVPRKTKLHPGRDLKVPHIAVADSGDSSDDSDYQPSDG